MQPLPRPAQAIFLDRDGVINDERPDYVKQWSEFAFLPGVLTALRRLACLDARILVVSNQSAIGRGLVSQDMVDDLHRRAQRIIVEAGGRIDAFFVCPHHPDDGCNCRKPKPGLLRQAATAFGLDLDQSVFIGDAISDFEAANAAGCHPILVETGRQGEQLRARFRTDPAAVLVADLSAAVALILAAYNEAYD